MFATIKEFSKDSVANSYHLLAQISEIFTQFSKIYLRSSRHIIWTSQLVKSRSATTPPAIQLNIKCFEKKIKVPGRKVRHTIHICIIFYSIGCHAKYNNHWRYKKAQYRVSFCSFRSQQTNSQKINNRNNPRYSYHPCIQTRWAKNLQHEIVTVNYFFKNRFMVFIVQEASLTYKLWVLIRVCLRYCNPLQYTTAGQKIENAFLIHLTIWFLAIFNPKATHLFFVLTSTSSRFVALW